MLFFHEEETKNIKKEKNGSNSFEYNNMIDSGIQKSPKIKDSIVEREINRTFSPDKNGSTSATVCDIYNDNSKGKDSALLNYDCVQIYGQDNTDFSTMNTDNNLYKERFTSGKSFIRFLDIL